MTNYNDDYDDLYDDSYESDDYDDYDQFMEPGGQSALRAATRDNPRIHPCGTCSRENMLTYKDIQQGYQCDFCADQDEEGL